MSTWLKSEKTTRNFMWVGTDKTCTVTILNSIKDERPLVDYHKLTEPGNASYVLGPNEFILSKREEAGENKWKLNLKQGNVLTVLMHYTTEDEDGNKKEHTRKEVRLGNEYDSDFIQSIIDEHGDIRGAKVTLERTDGSTSSGSFIELLEMTEVEEEANDLEYIKENYFVENQEEIERLVGLQF